MTDKNDKEHNRKLIEIKTRRLQKLQERQAREGIHSDPSVLLEIEDLKNEIKKTDVFPTDTAQTIISVENQSSHISGVTPKELHPISTLFDLIDTIKPIVFWVNRSVPSDKTQEFFEALQYLWCCNNLVTEGIDKTLARAIEVLLRPLASGHFLSKKSDSIEYVRAKLHRANHIFAEYFGKIDFEWDKYAQEISDIQDILYFIEINFEQVETSNLSINSNELNAIRLTRYILAYYKSIQTHKKYVGLSEGFVEQSLIVIETFLKNKMGYVLPEPFDDQENLYMRSLYE